MRHTLFFSLWIFLFIGGCGGSHQKPTQSLPAMEELSAINSNLRLKGVDLTKDVPLPGLAELEEKSVLALIHSYQRLSAKLLESLKAASQYDQFQEVLSQSHRARRHASEIERRGLERELKEAQARLVSGSRAGFKSETPDQRAYAQRLQSKFEALITDLDARAEEILKAHDLLLLRFPTARAPDDTEEVLKTLKESRSEDLNLLKTRLDSIVARCEEGLLEAENALKAHPQEWPVFTVVSLKRLPFEGYKSSAQHLLQITLKALQQRGI